MDPSTEPKLPPHSEEAERGVIGCILTEAECMPQCVESITPEMFFELRTREIYLAALELFNKGRAVDLVTVMQELKDHDKLEDIGGIGFLAVCQESIPSHHNLPEYIRILRQKASARALLKTCTETAARIYNSDIEELVAEHESKLASVSLTEADKRMDIRSVVSSAIDSIEASHRAGGSTGMATGFVDLDKLTCGLHPTEVFVLAGRPSTGKTAIAMNFVEHLAVNQKIPVGIFSLEMSSTSLAVRMLCSRARVDGQRVREGFISERDFTRLATASSAIANSPIFLDDTGSITMPKLRAKAARMVKSDGVKVIIIDYLQLLKSGGKFGSREAEVAEISRGIKVLVKELGVCGVVLCQLNRESDKEKRKPRMSDLRESGAIEQDADVVSMLYRPNEEDLSRVNLCVTKQRNGPTGEVELVYLREHTRFENVAKIKPEDVPV